MPGKEVKGWYPPCDQCWRSGNSKACALADSICTPMCNQCQKMKVKCYFEVLMATMKRLASGEKHKESEALPNMVTTSPQGGKKHKRMRKVVANTVSMEEIEEALGGFSVAGPSTWLDPVMQVLDR